MALSLILGGEWIPRALAPDACVVRMARGRTYPVRAECLEPPLNLLVVLNLACSPDLHGCSTAGASEVENLKLFDITDRRAPRLASTYPITGSLRAPAAVTRAGLRRRGGR